MTRSAIDYRTSDALKKKKGNAMSLRQRTTRLNALSRLASAALVGALLVGATLLNAPLASAEIDTDGDGLGDTGELLARTNPNIPDTDSDLATDGSEVVHYGTDPLDPDTDDDGVLDQQEVINGTNPLVADGGAAPEPVPGERPDRDGDGLYDDDESEVYGTDPDVADSDGDGVGDGEEVYLGTDPLD